MTPDRMLEAFRESTGPDADARTRLMGRLAALGPPAPATASATPQRRGVWPWVALGALAAAAALAFWIAPREQTAIDDASPPTMASDRAEAEAAGGQAIPRTAEPAPPRRPSAPAVVPTPDPDPEPDPAPLETLERRPKPSSNARRRPAPVEPPPAASPAPEPEPVDEVDTLAEELRLISRARAALSRGDAAGALSHLRTHASTFDAPRLGEEAAALRAMARCSQDGPDEAVARGFGRTFATSMFRARVNAACSPKQEQAESGATGKTEKTSPE